MLPPAGRLTSTSTAISELWSRFSDVAAGNPLRLVAAGADGRGDPHAVAPTNRMVGLPYTKYMNSNNDVDMAAAVMICSASKAESLGVPRDRWVFVHAGTDCHEHQYVSNRWSFAETPAIELGGRRVLELAGCGIDDVGADRSVLVLPVRGAARRAEPRAVARSPADAHGRAVVRRRAVEQLRDARDRDHGGRSAARAGRARAGVGERRLRHEALVRHLLDRATRQAASATTTRRPRSTRCHDASWPTPATRRGRPPSRRTP